MLYWVGEIIITVVLMAAAAAFYIGSLNFPGSMNPADVGPAAFPRLMAGLVILFGVAQLFITLKERKDTRERIPNKRGFILGVVSIFCYLLLMPVFGYFYATPLFCFIFMLLMGNRKWVQMIVVSAAFTVMAYYVFFKFLMVTLPL